MSAPGDNLAERPIFVVSPPRSGEGLLFLSLGQSPSAAQPAAPVDLFPEPGSPGNNGDRLGAGDVPEARHAEIRARLIRGLHDETPQGSNQAHGARPILASPKNALRVPALAEIFPDASFAFVFRDPAESIAAMFDAWESGEFVSHPDLEGWEGPPWSLPLIPHWSELSGKELGEIVTQQWLAITETLLTDLDELAPERWCAAGYGALLADPQGETERLCKFLGLEWDAFCVHPLVKARQEQLEAADPEAPKDPAIAAALPQTRELSQRVLDLLASTPLTKEAAEARLRSVSTGNFPRLLDQLSSSLLVTTYQTGKLICLRNDRGRLNTHFRDFPRPMGIAAVDGRIALGTQLEVWDYRNMPEAAAKLEPAGSHDACYLPRNRHYTGDIAIHELAYAQGELWIVATSFSCLATLDQDHSFVPRWAPPFISELAPEDRCHLNGLCVIENEVRFVTALGQTDSPGGWRENKAAGGCLIDVRSSETVVTGLCMPHSPRWHQDRLWLLESGKGTLSVVDHEAGGIETVAELPGFTRGLVFAGPLAFVGLSQVRESATFGGLPLTERLKERLCGVWAVNIETGETLGFARFEDVVKEIFDVALLTGMRFPEVAVPDGETTSSSFVLPD